MKVPKRTARKSSRGARRPDRREAHAKTSDLLPSVDWVLPQKPKSQKLKSQKPKPTKPPRGRKAT